MIEADQAVVYVNTPTEGGGDFLPYDADQLDRYATLSDETRTYYAQELAEGRLPFLFSGVPHVLYKGRIDTKGLEKVSL